MDQIEEQIISLQKSIMKLVISPKFLKKTSRFLVTIYLFSFLLSQYSFSWYPSFNISTLLNHVNDKNCIFLVFNGLLVFLAKTSGLLHSSPTSDLKDLNQYDTGLHHGSLTFDVKERVLYTTECNTYVSDHPLGYVKEEARDCSVEDKSHCISVLTFEDEVEDEDEDEEEELGYLDNEELDKRFDEFIRRMKEEIRVGADQPQLVMSSL